MFPQSPPQIGQQPDRSHPMMDGLVGWWTFQEGGGSNLFDVSGRGVRASLNSMTLSSDWVIGHNGNKALDFDGVNDYVQINTADNPLIGLSAVTFSYWFNVSTGYTGGLSRHISCGNQDDFDIGPNWNGSTIAGVLNGHMGMFIRNTGGWYDLGAIPDRGVWGHIAITASPSGLAACVNGKRTFSSGTAWTNGADGVLKFASRFSSGAFTSGMLSDVRVFNRALTDNEILRGLYLNPWEPFRYNRRTPLSIAAPAAGYSYNNFLHAQIGAC